MVCAALISTALLLLRDDAVNYDASYPEGIPLAPSRLLYKLRRVKAVMMHLTNQI